jgi:hypothetical protein
MAGRRRKRQRAARLRPIDVDVTATSSLFGHTAESNWRDTSSTPSDASASAIGEPSPLLRYEWRSPTGQVVVIEAGWPAGSDGIEQMGPPVRVNDGHHGHGRGFDHHDHERDDTTMDLRSGIQSSGL